ncbi:Adcy10, partial [Symbiodinium sp. KB8]
DVLIQKLKVQLKPQSLKRSRAQDPTVLTLLRRYIPAVVVPHLSLQGAAWAAELRTITVVFLNLGIQGIDRMPDPAEVDKLQAVLARVQAAIYRHEGSLNKFLVDDKGATLLAVFGLAPLAHENDPERAVLAAMDIKESMRSVGVTAWIGITSGTAFCGPIGSKTRQEYSVLGDVVNTSARLMQAAKAKSSTSGSSVGGGGANNSEGKALVPAQSFNSLNSSHFLWKPRTEPLLAAFAGYDTFLFNK